MATMTARQASAMERAIERATACGIDVVAQGRRTRDGAKVYCTPSHSDPSRWHVVTLIGDRLTCDCPAGQRGLLCMHRAAVYMELVVQAAKREALAKLVARAAEREQRASERAAAQAIEAQASTAPGQDAPLLRENRPLSIFK